MEASTIQKTIFKVAKQAYEELFRKGGTFSYRVTKQKLFPKGTTVLWNADYKCDWVSAWANRYWNTITVNCYRNALPTIEDALLKGVLTHELTHIAQFSIDSEMSEATSLYHAYVKANRMTGIFKYKPAFLAFLIPKEVEALVYQGTVLHQKAHKTSSPMESLEEISNFYLGKGYLSEMGPEMRAFAVENAIVNIIPFHPRLRALFAKDPTYTTALHDLKHKAKDLARASRLFIHLQNLVNNLDEKSVKRAIERFNKAYAKDHDPAVFERLLKRRRKKQRVCRACARARA